MAARSLSRDLTDTGRSNGQQEEDALLENPNNRTGTQDEKEDGDGDDQVSPYFRFFVVLNREIIQEASRHSLAKKFQKNMLINTAGTSVVPIGFLCFLTGLFTVFVFVLPVYFTASLPRVIKQAFREGGWCQALLATGIGVLFSMSMFSPLIVYYMHFVNDSLYDLVCNNVLSGMDVNMPLCFPLFVAGSMAMQTAEYCMTERLFRNMMDEYDDDSMFDATEGRDQHSTLVNTTDLRNLVDKMNEHLRDENERPLFEFSYFIEIKTKKDEFGSFDCSGDEGQMYIEKCAEGLITLSRMATSVTLPTWLKFFLPLVALLTASIGPGWMYFKHSGQYLAHASSVPIVVFSISFFLTFMMTFSVLLLVWCRLEFLGQVHRQIAVLLYLSATDIGRRLVSLSCASQLDTVFVRSPEASEPARLTASDPSLSLTKPLFPPICYTVETVQMLVDEMRRKRLLEMLPLPPDVTKDNEFKSIATYLFIEMRRWIKIWVTLERLPVQNVALGLLLVTASATVTTIASALFWQRLTAATPVCLFVALLFGALFISLLNSVILLNTILQETTSSMISQWVDKVKKEWLKRQIDLKDYVLEPGFYGELNHDCVKNMQVDNYFRTLLEPLRQYMEDVRTGEEPLKFFGIGVSLAWRNQLIAALFTAAASAVWSGLASYQDEIKDVATKHILVMANASTAGGANASSVL